MLEFNIDPDFSGVLDGLVLVDLTQTDMKLLERYMGKEGAKNFLEKAKSHNYTLKHKNLKKASPNNVLAPLFAPLTVAVIFTFAFVPHKNV